MNLGMETETVEYKKRLSHESCVLAMGYMPQAE